MKRAIITLMATICLPVLSFAHSLWMEVSGATKVGQKQIVKVFFGEYSEKLKEDFNKYAAMQEFKAWVVTAEGKIIDLQFTVGDNCMISEFTPAKKGVYTVWLDQSERPVTDLSKHGLGVVKPNTYCNSIVIIDNDLSDKKVWAKTSEMYIKPLHTASVRQDENVGFLAVFQSKPVPKQTITITSSNGWSKEVTTNDYGEFYLEPLWTGNYVFEFSCSNKTPGEYQSAKYEQIRYKLSTTLKVTE